MKNTFLCHSEHKMCISLHQRTLCDILMLVFRHNKCVKYKNAKRRLGPLPCRGPFYFLLFIFNVCLKSALKLIFLDSFRLYYKNSHKRDNLAAYSSLLALLSDHPKPYNLHEVRCESTMYKWKEF